MRPPRGKKKLIDAAGVLFESQGYFRTSIDEITAAAGVSKGLVYNYFSSKEELLVALLESMTERMATVAAGLATAREPGDPFVDFLDDFFSFLKSEKVPLRLQLNLMLMPELREFVEGPQRERAELLLKTMSDWFQKDGVAHPRKKARVLLAALDGVALHYLSTFENYPLASMKSSLGELAENLRGS